jgi:hypothetical protein
MIPPPMVRSVSIRSMMSCERSRAHGETQYKQDASTVQASCTLRVQWNVYGETQWARTWSSLERLSMVSCESVRAGGGGPSADSDEDEDEDGDGDCESRAHFARIMVNTSLYKSIGRTHGHSTDVLQNCAWVSPYLLLSRRRFGVRWPALRSQHPADHLTPTADRFSLHQVGVRRNGCRCEFPLQLHRLHCVDQGQDLGGLPWWQRRRRRRSASQPPLAHRTPIRDSTGQRKCSQRNTCG